VAVLIAPPIDADDLWPTLGPQIVDFLEDRGIYGPGSLKGEPYEVDDEFRAFLYRVYEVYPKGHPLAGRRRFKRGGYSVRKGLAKTEREALITYAELHPEAPVRCDGFDASGEPVGRPVIDPYIPMLAYSVDQVEELAYGALKFICEEGPDGDLFDVTDERIIRLSTFGTDDGKAVPVAQSPNSRDGARTTFQAFDEPHRLYLPRFITAHETMVANLQKRALEDPWGLYVGTAGQPGQGSIAENLHREARKIADGDIDIADARLCYFYRGASDGHDMSTVETRILAIAEATGPAGEWGPGQFRDIAEQWDREGADHSYLERVWLNRWVASSQQAYDGTKWAELKRPGTIAKGSPVVAGFDGARFRDSTAIVITDLLTGTQEPWGIWERPEDASEWEVDEDEVTQAIERLMKTMKVWKIYADPPHWTETVGSWSGRWPDKVEEWWTNRRWPMAKAVRAFREAIASGSVGWSEGAIDAPALNRHIGAAGRADLPESFVDDDGTRLFILKKISEERKFDAAMAATLSWQAYLDGVKAGKNKAPARARVRRIR
jgi:hypothetical protein